MMRLLLDYCKSVDEAVDMLSHYNIAFAVNPEHLMLADSTGEMVIVEFLEGEMRLIDSPKDWLVCTNHVLWSNSSDENAAVCDRYRMGSAVMDKAHGNIDYQSFSNAVRSMSVDNWTMWTSIYDLDSRTASVLYKARTETKFVDQSMAVGTD